jgi:hypothetical protein
VRREKKTKTKKAISKQNALKSHHPGMIPNTTKPNTHTNRLTNKQTNKQKQTYKQTNKQKQTDKQKET